MNNRIELLDQLGLTETEYDLYFLLLQNREILPGEIVKKSQLHRATVYDVLNRLIEKGLVSYTLINKKRYYSPANPEKFFEILKEKKKQLDEIEKDAAVLVKNLLQLKSLEKTGHIVEIYEGKNALKTIMQDILKTNQDFYVLGGEIQFREILPHYTPLWASEREKRKIFAKILTTVAKKSDWKMNELKQIRKNYNLPIPTIIYGDKIAIILYETPITIISIHSKTIAITYKNYFKMLWDLF